MGWGRLCWKGRWQGRRLDAGGSSPIQLVSLSATIIAGRIALPATPPRTATPAATPSTSAGFTSVVFKSIRFIPWVCLFWCSETKLSSRKLDKKTPPGPPRARATPHPGVLATKVGYFGAKSTNVQRLQMRDGHKTWYLLKSVALAPGELKCGAAPTPHRRAPPQKGRFDPRREQSC